MRLPKLWLVSPRGSGSSRATRPPPDYPPPRSPARPDAWLMPTIALNGRFTIYAKRRSKLCPSQLASDLCLIFVPRPEFISFASPFLLSSSIPFCCPLPSLSATFIHNTDALVLFPSYAII
ncbi:hypothetical protein FIBSPDRAFT_859738 [Athelia psychrophila]|uniref:Uncharacterized protein n=1 Tax=Athelia psychrophila TaxID=1759441 RepID=A0A167XQ19_9AGAM|nr:hypothetical protein FIBSPDRAFT_875469 [Fibularhizoctonia sp. CBS 109695]KZP22175.1 hypothetical protein FIBSPDRAFT_859738 [Fibularhizoctonia sp. CBS 109695]